jgi:pyruvate formate lyase activating enzyme
MVITAMTKTTLLDYPNHLASTLFLQGCNFLCPFCHNKDLIASAGTMPAADNILDTVLPTLKKRRHLIEGVCITGGEPTLQKDLPQLIRSIKELGLKVKLDTNGSNPSMLAELLDEGLLNYLAMDIKNSATAYDLTCGKSVLIQSIESSLYHLINYKDPNFSFELRTTILQELHTLSTLNQTAEWLVELGLSSSTPWYLQEYVYSPMQMVPTPFTAIKKETLTDWLESLQHIHPSILLRGYD